ncbi:hypothetical protein GCM10018952_75700 [Streptosporangium vulgare]
MPRGITRAAFDPTRCCAPPTFAHPVPAVAQDEDVSSVPFGLVIRWSAAIGIVTAVGDHEAPGPGAGVRLGDDAARHDGEPLVEEPLLDRHGRQYGTHHRIVQAVPRNEHSSRGRRVLTGPQ